MKIGENLSALVRRREYELSGKGRNISCIAANKLWVVRQGKQRLAELIVLTPANDARSVAGKQGQERCLEQREVVMYWWIWYWN